MANNSILKLQVDDKQYEASLKNAQQGLTALQSALRNSGKSFADVDKQTEEYVRALGKMGTTAKTARGGIGEMSSAFVELSRIEKQLTDQERQSPVGKALTKSLAKLKQRTIDAKNELQGLENQIKNVGEVKLPDTSGLFGGGKLDGMLQVFGGNLMTKGAGMLAGLASEMGDMVKQGIELAKQGEGIRIAFERLGRGDILQGLREATHGTVTDLELMKAAVKFNDFKLPVEELGTMLAFAQQKAKDTGQSVDYMVDSIVTGLGRKSLMILDNLGLSANEIKEKMKGTGDMTKAVGEIIREQMAKAGDYVETAADRATQADVDLKNAMEDLGRTFMPLQEAGVGMFHSLEIAALKLLNNALKPLVEKFTSIGRMQKAYSIMGGGGAVASQIDALNNSKDKKGTYFLQTAQYRGNINALQHDIDAIGRWQSGDRSKDLQATIGSIKDKYGMTSLNTAPLRAALDAQKKMLEEYKTEALKILNPVADAITDPTKVGGGSGSGGGKGTPTPVAGSIDEQTKKVQELQKAWRAAADDDSRQKIKAEIEEQQYLLDRMTGKEKFDPSKMQQITDLSGRTPWATPEQLTKGVGITLPVTLDIQSPEEKLQAEVKRLQDLLTNAFTDAEREAIGKALKDKKGELDKLTGGKGNAKPKEANLTQEFGKMAGGIQSIVGGIENLGVEIPEGMKQMLGGIQTMVSILSGISTIVTAIEALSAADTIIPFAHGGIVKAAGGYVVPGNQYSGDLVPAALSSGELILNRAQQGVIAGALEGGASRSVHVTGHLEGETIVLAADRYGRRTGKGELAFWK